ncbi:hypothetical protein SAMN02949497_0427 [Methylomagnum ishizawai]|uniref:Uncharacterized protein n=1 Tax=Methylomagnum ishizawai TaxID=1760988 RepID=A0A1Y6D4Q5_9GAMM|nr:hypothetical protein [Methylomagnum ishizawai]SMF97400.1 hypothetical protein SAMN02949497_0427 [Methylomagnum ishizawai]
MNSKVFTTALALALAAPGAFAALGVNELFLEVWNGDSGTGGQSYIKDLGVSLDDFLNAPGCFNYVVQDVRSDPNLAALVQGGGLPPGTVWTVQAFNDDYSSLLNADPGLGEQDPNNHTGILTTVTDPGSPDTGLSVFGTYIDFSGPVSALSIHLTNAGVEDSKAFSSFDTGYYFEPFIWDDRMNQTVGFASNQQVAGGDAMGMYFLTLDYASQSMPAIGHNGLPLGDWRFDGKQVAFTPATDTPVPADCPVGTQCALPWGGKLTSGLGVAAYQSATSTDCESTANKETRTCANGVLSGSFTQQACSAPKACDLPWGGTLASGQGVAAYKTAVSANCDAPTNKETRNCDNGVLSGSFSLQSCSTPKACDLPWGGTLASGQGVTAYKTAVSADCENAANKETRNCDNGKLGGSFANPACSAPQACDLPWGGTLASGQSVTAYQSATSTACEAPTNKQTRTCNNGTLGGSFANPACSAPQVCDLPWGGTLANGQSVTAYQTAASADCESAANKQTRTCANGVLSGDYTEQACTTLKACDLPWGGQIASGKRVTAYLEAVSTNCKAATNKQTRTCDDGVLDGEFVNPSCAAPKACDLPWGGQIASGDNVTAYQTATSLYCDSDALQETRTCDNGVLDGSFTAQSCAAPTGTFLWMIAPNGGETWKTGVRQYIEWASGNLPGNKRLNLYFSKDGGKQWRLVKRKFKNTGHVIWTPGNKLATETGSIRLCTVGSKRSPSLCDTSDQVFTVSE